MRVISLSADATRIIHDLGAADTLITPEQAQAAPPDLAIGGPGLTGYSGPVVDLQATTLDGVLDDLLRVGDALGRSREAQCLVVSIRERLDRAAEFVNAYEDGPGVAVLESVDPIRVSGWWVPQLIERAGGRSYLNQTGEPARLVTPEMLDGTDRLIITVADINETESAIFAHKWITDRVLADAVALVNADRILTPSITLIDTFEFLVGWLQDRPKLIPPAFPWSPARPGSP